MTKNTDLIKIQLRKDSKRIRSSLASDYRCEASRVICQLIQEWPIFQKSKTILTYMAKGSEVDLSPLLSRQVDKKWVIPRIKQGGQMDYHIYDPDKLIRHHFGMLEPDPVCTIVPSETIQLVLVPGLAFDLEGWRLGYGGGFYDRFLSQYNGISAGITYQKLLKPHVPHTAYDIPMQYVITENGNFPVLQSLNDNP